MGGKNWAWAMDEYGRHPGHSHYRSKKMHERDWITHEIAKREWAKKRVGKPVAQIDKFQRGEIYDQMMQEFLREQGLLTSSQNYAPEE